MADKIGKDVWQMIIEYLDIRSLERLLATCKFLNTLSIRRFIDDPAPTSAKQYVSSAVILRKKYDQIDTLRVKLYNIQQNDRFHWSNLTSLNITYNGEINISALRNMTALTFCAKLVPPIVPCKLRRLEIGEPADMSSPKTWNVYGIRTLTNLTYLKSEMSFVSGFKHLSLTEMDMSNFIGCELEKITSLTKLTLRNSCAGYIRLTTRLLELAFIDNVYGYGVSNFNYMTTLTSVTVIDSNVNISELKLRNLCICSCRGYNHHNVSNIRRVACSREIALNIPMEK